jgi:hypothetical protein
MNLPIQSKPVNRQSTASAAALNDAVNPSVCVGGSVNGRKICVNLPVIGTKCINSPISLPVGASVRACTCSHWGVPTGANVKVTAAGRTILSQNVGWC